MDRRRSRGHRHPRAARGAHRSGYVAKAWALPEWTPNEQQMRYGGSSAWYAGQPRTKRVDGPYLMNTFVYSGHMGLFVDDRGDGSWLTYEARDYGIPVGAHSRRLSDLAGRSARYYKRENW